jgi:hypothetical protein
MDASYLSYDSFYCIKGEQIKTKCEPHPEENIYLEVAISVFLFRLQQITETFKLCFHTVHRLLLNIIARPR